MMPIMKDETGHTSGRKILIYSTISFLALFSASASLETYLYLPNIVWIVGGVLVTSVWSFKKFSLLEEINDDTDGSYDCTACGLFGHKLPWILLVVSGLANLTDLSAAWGAFSAYAVAAALFSLTGSFIMMRIN